MNPYQPLKPIKWMFSSKQDIREFPQEVRNEVGHALHEAQIGQRNINVKTLRGLPSGVLEVITNYDTDTFRTVYTIRFPKMVYVLHCFQKKSKSGIATPQKEIELIKKRLKAAEEHYAKREERSLFND